MKMDASIVILAWIQQNVFRANSATFEFVFDGMDALVFVSVSVALSPSMYSVCMSVRAENAVSCSETLQRRNKKRSEESKLYTFYEFTAPSTDTSKQRSEKI